MVKHLSMIEEWRRRLNELSLPKDSSRESSWLQEVQAKVLRYFISRYEGNERYEREFPPVPSELTSPRIQIARFNTTDTSPSGRNVSSQTVPGRTMKSRMEIRQLLERIRDVSNSHINRCS